MGIISYFSSNQEQIRGWWSYENVMTSLGWRVGRTWAGFLEDWRETLCPTKASLQNTSFFERFFSKEFSCPSVSFRGVTQDIKIFSDLITGRLDIAYYWDAIAREYQDLAWSQETCLDKLDIAYDANQDAVQQEETNRKKQPLTQEGSSFLDKDAISIFDRLFGYRNHDLRLSLADMESRYEEKFFVQNNQKTEPLSKLLDRFFPNQGIEKMRALFWFKIKQELKEIHSLFQYLFEDSLLTPEKEAELTVEATPALETLTFLLLGISQSHIFSNLDPDKTFSIAAFFSELNRNAAPQSLLQEHIVNSSKTFCAYSLKRQEEIARRFYRPSLGPAWIEWIYAKDGELEDIRIANTLIASVKDAQHDNDPECPKQN